MTLTPNKKFEPALVLVPNRQLYQASSLTDDDDVSEYLIAGDR